MAFDYIPEGYKAVNPYFVIENPETLVEFALKVFDAEMTESIEDENGRISHAEIKIGDSIIMMGRRTESNTPYTGMMYVYVENVDETYKKALDAGAQSVMEPVDMYYGDRNGGVIDTTGITWWIATRFEEVTPEELQKRAAENRR